MRRTKADHMHDCYDPECSVCYPPLKSVSKPTLREPSGAKAERDRLWEALQKHKRGDMGPAYLFIKEIEYLFNPKMKKCPECDHYFYPDENHDEENCSSLESK